MAPATVVKEMCLTRADFLRLLPGAAGALPVSVDGDRERPAAGLEITLTPLPDRRIALLRLPVLRVAITVHGLDEPARRAALERFDTAFRRGGG
ncbi:hypothetical protein [Azospirillum halopraeferens]|uniref:hypothetical protein n=1 Tax=Azospirillum halopraeferens TaxID=34010 RepID=UPI000407AA2D|nr:hypothetical protein [Azospirillum halopraeferens]